MSEIKTTRLRFISTSLKEDLMALIDSIGFKIEIKSIIKDGPKYTIFFVLPEEEGIRFNSVDLTQ